MQAILTQHWRDAIGCLKQYHHNAGVTLGLLKQDHHNAGVTLGLLKQYHHKIGVTLLGYSSKTITTLE